MNFDELWDILEKEVPKRIADKKGLNSFAVNRSKFEVQNSLGVRISETFEIVKNIDGHYSEAKRTIENLIGNGNHAYELRMIGSELVEKIRACENVPSQKHL